MPFVLNQSVGLGEGSFLPQREMIYVPRNVEKLAMIFSNVPLKVLSLLCWGIEPTVLGLSCLLMQQADMAMRND